MIIYQAIHTKFTYFQFEDNQTANELIETVSERKNLVDDESMV